MNIVKKLWRKWRQQDRIEELQSEITKLKAQHKQEKCNIYDNIVAEVGLGMLDFNDVKRFLGQLCGK